MIRSSRKQVGVIYLVTLLAAVTLTAEEPAKKAETVKPPWQRYLQGEDAKKAVEPEKQRTQLQAVGKFEDALKVAEAVAKLRSKAQGADHWQAVNARSDVEALRLVLRQGEETRKQYAASFDLLRQANTLRRQGNYKAAQPLLEKLVAIHRKALGEDHPDTATTYDNLANNLTIKLCGNLARDLIRQNRYTEAEEDFRKMLAICRKVLGEEHPLTAGNYNSLAGSLNAKSKYREAEQDVRKALAIRRKMLGEGVAHGKRPALSPLEEAPAAEKVKEDRPFAHPYYWAAFVLIGHAE